MSAKVYANNKDGCAAAIRLIAISLGTLKRKLHRPVILYIG